MRIIVKDQDTNLNLPLPTGLVINRLTAGVACAALKKQGVPITQGQMARLMKEWRRFRRRYPKWTLVEVEGHEGEHVKIEL